MRIQQIFQEVRVLLDHFIVPVERLSGLRAQLLHLIADPLFRAGNGALNRGVHFTNGFVQVLDALFNLLQAAVKRPRQFLWDVRAVHFLA